MLKASQHFPDASRSAYIARTSRDRRAKRRAMRNAIIAGLALFCGLACSLLGYAFLAMPEAIAANTGDSVRLIQTIGLFGSIAAFCFYISIPLLYIFDLAD